MAQTSPSKIHGEDMMKRPKGILKNSFRQSSQISPTREDPPLNTAQAASMAESPASLVHTNSSDKELTLQNTLQNAGHRRSSSSNTRNSISRRQSGNSNSRPSIEADENNPRLKWDEANLYLTEQEKSSTMKINEPKTPYAKHYEPSDDEEDIHTLDADGIVVDELDKVKGRTCDARIPGLELGEPEEAVPVKQLDEEGQTIGGGSSKGEKQVVVNESDEGHGHGEEEGWSWEEREKHRKFEERRKRHYEMKEVKGLLGHPENVDDMDEDDDSPAHPSSQSSLPYQSQSIMNGA